MTNSTKVVRYENDENRERGNWSSKMDFILSAIGYAVGLGNVWRFPYRAYQNGGASFMVPYVITLVLAGIPMFFLEMALGQFSSLGPVSVWKMVPVLKGLGWSMVIVNVLCSIYYNMIIAYTLYYLFASLTTELPWQSCRPEWMQYGCWDRASPNATLRRNITAEWCREMERENVTESQEYIFNCTLKPKTPSEIYWEREVLDMSSGIDEDAFVLKWQLALCLLLAWVIVFLCLIKGIKSSGKVVYFTAVFPYVVLVILLIWNARLEGAWLGIQFYIVPDWSKLTNAKVWYSAGTQIFYSLGIAFGTLETMASYNRFHNKVHRDAVLVAVINCSTSVLAGFVIFSVVGHMATVTGLPVSQVVAAGPGLAFIAYPEGLAMMPVAPLWSVLFFLMLFSLGIDSQFGGIEAILTAVVDEFPVLRQGRRKTWFTLACCALMYIVGLSQCSRAGIYVFTLFDWYSAGLNVIVICLIEVTAISWIYGIRRFSADVEMMLGHRPNYYFVTCWVVLTPLMMMFLFLFSIIDNSPASYADYVLPPWADGIGWAMFASTLSAVLISAILQTCRVWRNGEDWRELIRPTPDWGPALDEFRTGAYAPDSTRCSGVIITAFEPSNFVLCTGDLSSDAPTLNKRCIQAYNNHCYTIADENNGFAH